MVILKVVCGILGFNSRRGSVGTFPKLVGKATGVGSTSVLDDAIVKLKYTPASLLTHTRGKSTMSVLRANRELTPGSCKIESTSPAVTK